MACPVNVDEYLKQVAGNIPLTKEEEVYLRKVYKELTEVPFDNSEFAVGDEAMEGYVKPPNSKGTDVTNEVKQWLGGNKARLKVNNSAYEIDRDVISAHDDGHTVTVKFEDRTRTFDKGQDSSHRVDSSRKEKYVVWQGFGQRAYDFRLGNKDSKRNKDNLVKDAEYKHGDIESMTKMLDKLHEMGGGKATDEQMSYYKGLLGRMSQKFFTDMDVFIKKTSKESWGEITGEAIEFGINSKGTLLASNQQTEAEIYMHEIIHAMTKFARMSKDLAARKIDRELDFILDHLRKRLTWKDFLPKESINAELEKANAEELYKYIFESENHKDEFIAHVLTNPAVKELMQKLHIKGTKDNRTVLERIVDMFSTLVDIVLGNYKFSNRHKSVYDQVYSLAFELAEINNRATAKEEQADVITKASEVVNDIDATIANKLNKLKDKIIADDGSRVPDYPINGGRLAKAKWLAKLLKKAAVNEQYGKALGLIASSFKISPNGILRNVLRDFKEAPDAEKAVEWLQLQSDTIEGKRNSLAAATRQNIVDMFSRRLTKAENKVITDVGLDLDLGSLLAKKGKTRRPHQYSMSEIAKLLTDEEYLQKELSRAHHRLEVAGGKEYYNWYSNQAAGLGYYLASGKANIAQNLNAVNIARGLGSGHFLTPTPKVIIEVDTIATLKAIQYTNRHKKLQMAELIKDQRNGVESVLRMHKGFNEEAKETLFNGDSTHMVKGYSKEVFDDTIEMTVAPISEKEDMLRAGYEFKKEIKDEYSDGEPMGLFVTRTFGRAEWQRGATRLVSAASKGTTITETKYADKSEFAYERALRDIAKIDVARLKLADKMIKGTYDPTANEHMDLVPLLDANGLVVNYRYVMDKEAKEDLLNQDKNVVEVLSRSYGAMLDKAESPKHNKKVLEDILKNMKENWSGGILGNDLVTEYTLIGPNETDSYAKEVYKILPKEFKDTINERDDKVIAVPTHMMPVYFGYRHMSAANSEILQKYAPKIVTTILRIAEGIWQEVVKIAVSNILLKIPKVIYDNIISNIVQGIINGISPSKIIKAYIESFRDVRAHIRAHREYMKLESKRIAGNITVKEKARMAILDTQMKENPVHVLFEAGMYQAFQEDVENVDTRGTNKVKRYFDEKLDNVPMFVKAPLQWLYLSEETRYYKVMQEALQMSDLIARDVQFRFMKEKIQAQVDGKKKMPADSKYAGKKVPLEGKERSDFIKTETEKALYLILQQFINYNKPSSRMEAYIRRMGTIKFTAYTKRIQPVIANMATEHPLRMTLATLAQNYITDFSSVQDQSLITKGFFAHGFDPANMLRTYSMGDDLMRAVEPGLITVADSVGLVKSPF